MREDARNILIVPYQQEGDTPIRRVRRRRRSQGDEVSTADGVGSRRQERGEQR
jgi:hypothetical protein